MAIIQKVNSLLESLFRVEVIKTRPREAVKFAKKYFKNKEIIALEVGVLKGESSKDMLKNLKIRKLYLIDPYEKYAGYENYAILLNLKEAEKIAKKKLRRYNEKINWIKEFSETGLKKIKENVDFIYIDGNHEHAYVKKDLELGWKILKRGGIVSGHDIQSLDVSRAVLNFAKKAGLNVHFGERRDWWMIKE